MEKWSIFKNINIDLSTYQQLLLGNDIVLFLIDRNISIVISQIVQQILLLMCLSCALIYTGMESVRSGSTEGLYSKCVINFPPVCLNEGSKGLNLASGPANIINIIWSKIYFWILIGDSPVDIDIFSCSQTISCEGEISKIFVCWTACQ